MKLRASHYLRPNQKTWSYNFVTLLEAIAQWIDDLLTKRERIPDELLAIAKSQTAAMLHRLPLMAEALGHPCDLTDFLTYSHLKERIIESVYFDWDDCSLIGHPGHTAILIPQCEADRNPDLTQEEILTATVIGDELISRLGAAVLFGPQNGQTISFPHQISVVAMLGYLRKWPKSRLIRTLHLAISQPHFALYPAFFSFAKPTIAWFPVKTALAAIEVEPLLDDGQYGDLINGKFGLLSYFSYLPNSLFLADLGRLWLTATVQVKNIPGCAYIIGPTVQWLKWKVSAQPTIQLAEIESIEIATSVFGLGVEAMMRKFVKPSDPLTTHEVSFSVSLTMAVALLNDGIKVNHLTPESLKKQASLIRDLASRIKVTHDWKLTFSFLKQLDQHLNLRGVFSSLALKDLLRVVLAAKKYSSGNIGMKALLVQRELYSFFFSALWSRILHNRPDIKPLGAESHKATPINLSPCNLVLHLKSGAPSIRVC